MRQISVSIKSSLLVSCFLLLSGQGAAQQIPNNERGVNATSYKADIVDQVNLYNGNLSLTIPLGKSYTTGGGLGFKLTLVYNSNAWEIRQEFDPHATNDQHQPGDIVDQAIPNRKNNAGMGWTLSLGNLYSPRDQIFNQSGSYWLYVAPDGSEHRFLPGEEVLNPHIRRYTKDGTYLRLWPDGREVEFPNGERHVFDAAGRLLRISDPWGNRIEVTYQSILSWKITEYNWGQALREHFIDFDSQGKITFVKLASFGSGNETKFEFKYSPQPVSIARHYNNKFTWPAGSVRADVYLLEQLVLPAGAGSYRFEYSYDYDSTTSQTRSEHIPGVIKKATLPTGGRYEWLYGPYIFGAGDLNGPNSKLPPTYARRMRLSEGVKQKKVFAEGTPDPIGTYTYDHKSCKIQQGGADLCINDPDGSIGVQPEVGYVRTSVQVKTTGGDDPGDHLEVRYFENTLYRWDYALPYTRQFRNGNMYLSKEIYKGTTENLANKLRSVYVRYEGDITDDNYRPLLEEAGNNNSRLAGERTIYHDDQDRIAEVNYSDWDGVSNYRTVTTGGNFDKGNIRSTTTNYVLNSIPADWEPWVLGLYNSQTVMEDNASAKVQYCFNSGTGALTGTRTLKNGVSPSPADIVVAYFYDSDGSLTVERFFGGDKKAGLNSSNNFCNTALPNIVSSSTSKEYERVHTYSHGMRATSKFLGQNFFTLNQDIDRNSGLVSATRDSALVPTTYKYDSLGRVTEANPDGEFQIKYDYSPNSITTTRRNGSTIVTSSQIGYDNFGRVTEEIETLPGGVTSGRRTKYNALGWTDSVSEFGNYSKKTQYSQYDPFGRPRQVAAADNTVTSFEYSGVSSIKRTVKIGTAYNSSTGAVTRSDATTAEYYDRQGRLSIVDEPSGPNSATIGTKYNYDIGNRLSEVSINYQQALPPTPTPTPTPAVTNNDQVWVEDSTPAGAVLYEYGDSWTWTDASVTPAPFSGASAHASSPVAGPHQHYFDGATQTMSVGAGDQLFTYVYLDPASPPTEVMLQWNDGTWEHRAYWGANQLPWGTDNTQARRYMGPLPAVGQWVRLEVPAGLVGLEGRSVSGMAFSLYDGRVFWDRSGKTAVGGGQAQVNLSQGKTTTQSTTAYGGLASRAVDGNVDGIYNNNSVTHTDYQVQPWWQVDLGGVKFIDQIKFWNRTDCCAERLANFYVLVSDVPFTSNDLATARNQAGVTSYYIAGPVGAQAAIPVWRSGRYVRVQLVSNNFLSLAEVQVMGRTSLSQGKTATQSTTVIGAAASRAVDGNLDGNFNNNSVTHSDYQLQPWWQVDLGSVQPIGQINLWNRTDCACPERLENFYVFVSDVPFTSTNPTNTLSQPGVAGYYMAGKAGPSIAFNVGRTGRYVRVQLAGTNFLSLAEVEVISGTISTPPPSPTPEPPPEVGQKRFFTYDNRGFLVSETHPELGATGNGTVCYGHYDAEGKCASDYDTLGNVVQKTEGNNSLKYSYDAGGRLTNVSEFVAGVWRPIKDFQYYNSINNNDQTDRRLGKLSKAIRHNHIKNPYSTETTPVEVDVQISDEYVYKGLGGRANKRTTRLNDTATGAPVTFVQNIDYNQLGLPMTQRYPVRCTDSLTPQNPCGQTTASEERNVQYEYEYGYLRNVRSGNVNYATAITYLANKQLSTIPHGNGVTDRFEMDPNHMARPARIWTTGAKTMLGTTVVADNWDSEAFDYDGAGNIVKMGSDWFIYDKVNRIVEGTAQTGVNNKLQSYGYDALGNLVEIKTYQNVNKTGTLTPITLQTNPTTNRLSGSRLFYDASGNIRGYSSDEVPVDTTLYIYDSLQMLKYSYKKENATKPIADRTYLYNADDERVWIADAKARQANGRPEPELVVETVTLRGLKNEVLRDYQKFGPSGAWTWQKDYIYRSGSLLASETTGLGRRDYHLDHLGTPRLITDATGFKVEKNQYLPFGKQATDPGPGEDRMKFTGHERDQVPGFFTFDYMHARFYATDQGRFLSIDPGRDWDPKQPQSWNLYSYVRNNPINVTDPSGTTGQNCSPLVLPIDPVAAVQASTPADTRNLRQTRVTIEVILDEAKAAGLTPAQTAYLLATAEHESNMGNLKTETWGPTSDQLKYPEGKTYRGRGLVHITHGENYMEAGIRVGLGADLFLSPAKATDLRVAAKVGIDGMVAGTFRRDRSGHPYTLDRFINNQKTDFYGARRIINGDIKTNGAAIARQARSYLKALTLSGW